jgi:hypothetical protein
MKNKKRLLFLLQIFAVTFSFVLKIAILTKLFKIDEGHDQEHEHCHHHCHHHKFNHGKIASE